MVYDTVSGVVKPRAETIEVQVLLARNENLDSLHEMTGVKIVLCPENFAFGGTVDTLINTKARSPSHPFC